MPIARSYADGLAERSEQKAIEQEFKRQMRLIRHRGEWPILMRRAYRPLDRKRPTNEDAGWLGRHRAATVIAECSLPTHDALTHSSVVAGAFFYTIAQAVSKSVANPLGRAKSGPQRLIVLCGVAVQVHYSRTAPQVRKAALSSDLDKANAQSADGGVAIAGYVECCGYRVPQPRSLSHVR